MTFEDLIFTPLYDGVQAQVDFGKYKLSVVRHEYSYGGSKGLYEIMVSDRNYNQMCLPGITNDGDSVKGYLTETDLTAILKKMLSITGVEGVQ